MWVVVWLIAAKRPLGPAGTPHPLCHGSASARMLSARRRHLSRRWRNQRGAIITSQSQSQSRPRSCSWRGKTRHAKRSRTKRSVQNVWYECKTAKLTFFGLHISKTFLCKTLNVNCVANVWQRSPFHQTLTKRFARTAKHFVCVRFIECKLWPNERK